MQKPKLIQMMVFLYKIHWLCKILSYILSHFLIKRILWCKKTTKIWDVHFDNIAISKLIETKNKYLIGYIDDVTRPLVLILLNMS